MRNNKLVIGIIIAIALVVLAVGVKALVSAGKGKRSQAAVARAAAKRTIPKGMGGLTVKILNSKKAEIPMRIKTFKVIDADSSVYTASTVGGRMQELLPGAYDVEIDTMPQKILKNIKVNEGKETLKDLGCVTGALMVRVINAKNAPAYYPLRILNANTSEMVTAFMTNKALEIVPGVYDIEVGTSPRQYKKNVRVEAGKEAITDMGCITGTLYVKAVDENKKDVRAGIRITRADTGEIVTIAVSNKPAELVKGKYNIEVLSSPKQVKKDVSVNTGEETSLEFTVAQSQVVKNVQAPPKPAAPKQPVKAKK